jgi:hypothetical protein
MYKNPSLQEDLRRLPLGNKVDPSAVDRFGSGGQIRTDDLRVMSPTSYQTAPPRNNKNATEQSRTNNLNCCNMPLQTHGRYFTALSATKLEGEL